MIWKWNKARHAARLGHAGLDQSFFLQLLFKALFDGFIQLAPFALGIGVDCKRVSRRLMA